MKLRKLLAALLTVLLLTGLWETALGDKARKIRTAEDEAFHAAHLMRHLNDTTCRVTGNYIKVRTSAKSNASLSGHLEQADTFVLTALEGSFAHIRVLESAESSPDSYGGMEGWVTAAYVDCTCSDAAYRADETADDLLMGGFFPVGMPSQWYFCSGAGGWSTELTIMEDGTFSGYYHDWDGGGDDAYPRGTLEECTFTGCFAVPERISACEYLVVVDSLTQEGTPGDSFVRDEMLVTISHPYGIGKGDWFIIYLPGTALNRIPPAYHEWAAVRSNDWNTLAFAMYNMTDGFGWNEGE